MVPFLTVLEASDGNTTLLPFVAPVNHNKVNEYKMVQIIHTLMGKFCHGDKDEESQPKVSSCYLQQDIPNWNYLFHFLTIYFISMLH